jgi:hypothetical protein
MWRTRNTHPITVGSLSEKIGYLPNLARPWTPFKANQLSGDGKSLEAFGPYLEEVFLSPETPLKDKPD